MTELEAIQALQMQIEELSVQVRKMMEIHNTQYTDIMLKLEHPHHAPDTRTDDELYGEAKQIILAAGKASTSYLQRKLKLGYARAAQIMDKLEEEGIIGPADGASPRKVLGTDETSHDEEKDEDGDIKITGIYAE